MVGKNKRGEQGLSSSSAGTPELKTKKARTVMADREEHNSKAAEVAAGSLAELMTSLKTMNSEMHEHVSKLYEEINVVRFEMKAEIQQINQSVKEVEKS